MNEIDNLNQSQEYTLEIKKHSRLGIASFILAIISVIGFFISITLSIIFVSKVGPNIDPNQIKSEMFKSSMYIPLIISSLLLWLSFFENLVGVGLGIAGLIQKKHKKVFSILGFIFNILPLILIIALIAFSFYIMYSSGGIQLSQ